MIEFTPIEPALLTDAEAAQYLRLTENGEDAVSARSKMNRLVDQKKLRPCLTGGKRRYAKAELDRYIASETEHYGEVRS